MNMIEEALLNKLKIVAPAPDVYNLVVQRFRGKFFLLFFFLLMCLFHTESEILDEDVAKLVGPENLDDLGIKTVGARARFYKYIVNEQSTQNAVTDVSEEVISILQTVSSNDHSFQLYKEAFKGKLI